MAEPISQPTISLDLEGQRLPADDFLEAVRAFLDILRDVDIQTTSIAGGSLEWVIEDLSGGSAHLTVSPRPRGPKTPFGIGRTVANRFRDGVRQVASTAERPPFFSETGMRRALQLTALLKENGIREITFRVDGERVPVGQQLARNVRDVVEGTMHAIGSIEGRLETLSVHGRPYFNVYDSVTGRAVQCSIPEELIETAHRAFNQRVQVRGLITTRPNGEVMSMRVREIATFPDPRSLPTVDDIRGILRNA